MCERRTEGDVFARIRTAVAEGVTRQKIEWLRTILSRGGTVVEPGFWHDPYVVGYLEILIYGLLKNAAGGKLHPEYGGFASARCWAHLTGLPENDYWRQGTDTELRQHPQFKKGCDAAALLLIFLQGEPNLKNPVVQSLIDQARQLSRQYELHTGERTDPIQSVASFLLTRDLISRLKGLRTWNDHQEHNVF
jgi:hypothetical protein